MRGIKLFSVVLAILLLSGCFDYNELNMQELVLGASVDTENGNLAVSVSCAATGSPEEKLGASYSASGGTFFDAVRSISLISSKKLYWGHARTLLLSEDAARTRMDELLDAILRARDVHLDIIPVVVRGADAASVLSAKTPDGKSAADSLADAFANENNSRRYRAKRVWEILRERDKYGFFILPSVELSEEMPMFSGGAVIRDGKAPLFLDGEEMLFLSLLTEKSAGGFLPPTELADGGSVSFEILASDIKQYGDEIRQSCVLSPAEVSGTVTDEELKLAAEKLLFENAEKLCSRLYDNGLENILGGATAVHCEVRISNILGGR